MVDHIPTVQDYINQRNDVFEEFRKARNSYWRNSHLKNTDPIKYCMFKVRYERLFELFQEVQRLAKEQCEMGGLRYCGSCSRVAYIGKMPLKRTPSVRQLLTY